WAGGVFWTASGTGGFFRTASGSDGISRTVSVGAGLSAAAVSVTGGTCCGALRSAGPAGILIDKVVSGWATRKISRAAAAKSAAGAHRSNRDGHVLPAAARRAAQD